MLTKDVPVHGFNEEDLEDKAKLEGLRTVCESLRRLTELLSTKTMTLTHWRLIFRYCLAVYNDIN